MSLTNLIWLLSVFWIIAHLLYRSVVPQPGDTGLLPSHAVHDRARITPRRRYLGFPLSVSLHYVHLKIESTAFNAPHAILTTSFAKPTNSRRRRAIRVFYDIGSVASVLGLLFAFGLLLLTAGQVSWRCYDIFAGSYTTQSGGLGKRSVVDESSLSNADAAGLAINPIVSMVDPVLRTACNVPPADFATNTS